MWRLGLHSYNSFMFRSSTIAGDEMVLVDGGLINEMVGYRCHLFAASISLFSGEIWWLQIIYTAVTI
jgi:hypothetical protein